MKFDEDEMQEGVIPCISNTRSNLEKAKELLSKLDIPDDFTYSTLLKDDIEEIHDIINDVLNLKALCEEMIEDFDATENANEELANDIGLTTSNGTTKSDGTTATAEEQKRLGELKTKGSEKFAYIAGELFNAIQSGDWLYDTYGGNSVPLEKGDTEIDCSTYVTWVLYEYGYTDLTSQLVCKTGDFVKWCKDSDLYQVYEGCASDITEVENVELQPGDIVIQGSEDQEGGDEANHVQIFAGYDDVGDALWYSCGGTEEGDVNYAAQSNEELNNPDENHNTLYVYRVLDEN